MSSAIATCVAGREAGALDRLRPASRAPPRWSRSRATSRPRRRRRRSARAPASGGRRGGRPRPSTRAPAAKLARRGQTTMKSWMSTRRPACAPPPKIWICGIGSSVAVAAAEVLVQRHAAATRPTACAAAIDTASVALAPRRVLVGVPSSSIRRAVERGLVVGAQADERARDLAVDVADRLQHVEPAEARAPPSRSSCASRVPLDAPAGAIARPTAPSCSVTSASTVGRPRLSHTRRRAGSNGCRADSWIELLRARRPAIGSKASHRVRRAAPRRRGAPARGRPRR